MTPFVHVEHISDGIFWFTALKCRQTTADGQMCEAPGVALISFLFKTVLASGDEEGLACQTKADRRRNEEERIKWTVLQIHFPSPPKSVSHGSDWQAWTHTRTELHTQAKLKLTWAYYGCPRWSGVCRSCNNEAFICSCLTAECSGALGSTTGSFKCHSGKKKHNI